MGRGRGSAEGAETLAALPGLLAATHVSKLTLGSDDAGLRFSIADGDQTKTVFEALINTLHALDGQVERKEMTKVAIKSQDLAQEQQALSHVAREMQEARFRTWTERKQQEEALRSTWAKQQQLKLMEATLEKAEGA